MTYEMALELYKVFCSGPLIEYNIDFLTNPLNCWSVVVFFCFILRGLLQFLKILPNINASQRLPIKLFLINFNY